MAGIPIDARASSSTTASSDSQPLLLSVAASSRTRRNHGVFLVGDEMASVYSTRRQADELGVTLAIGAGSLVVTGGMTPAQARVMAKALQAAALAAEALQARQVNGAAA